MRALVIAFLVFISACTTSEKFEKHIASENCEEALREAPHNKNDFKLISESQYAAGTVLSYSVTGTAYAADVLVFLSTEVVLSIMICSPIILIDGSLHANGNISGHCINSVSKDLDTNPNLGSKTYEATKPFRCPRVDTISQAVRKVASCYVKKGGTENNEKALKTLQSVRKSEPFYRCLTPSEREVFTQEFDSIWELNQKTSSL